MTTRGIRSTCIGRLCTFGCLVVLAATGCSSTVPTSKLGAASPRASEATTANPIGYLSAAELPDSAVLLPPPPESGSAALAQDEEVHRSAVALRDTPRYALATLDADLSLRAPGTFACALGVPIDAQHTPRLHQLLQRASIDAGWATGKAKARYQRKRPFEVHGEASCTPAEEEKLRKSGSYPSGHTSVGWAWALVLAEVDPQRADAIFARGRSYGESRLVCDVHWQSDILAGRFIGAVTVARMHANPSFREDIEAARAEIVAARAEGLATGVDCAAEAAALAQQIPHVL